VESPQVSVIIPTYNRLERLQMALEAFNHQTVDPSRFEVVVVSDGSTDGTDEFLRGASTSFPLKAVFQTNAGPAAARNRGVDLARGEIVLFVDDDVVAQPDLIYQHLVSHQENSEPVVVIGPMLTPTDFRLGPYVRWEQAMLYKQYEAMTSGIFGPTFRQFYTGNASLRRELLVAVGPFNERLRRAEDIELAHRLARSGAGFIFNKAAIGYHYATRSFSAWLQIAHDYGVNDVVVGRWQRSSGGLETVRREFAGRHRLVRLLTRTFLGRPWLQCCVRLPIRAVATASYRLGLEGVGRSALSGLYNASYYGGLAEGLGGRDEFLRLIHTAHGSHVSKRRRPASVGREPASTDLPPPQDRADPADSHSAVG
jgi:glycosyltransferase involved in cell wall biosynthesis